MNIEVNRQPGVIMEKLIGKSRGFRPRGKTRDRIEFAEQLGVNISELVCKILDDHLQDYLKKEVGQRQNQLRKLVDAPIP